MNTPADKPLIEPSDDDWREIQKMVDDDCPMSIVAQLGQKEISWEEACNRIEAYAKAAFTRGRSQ